MQMGIGMNKGESWSKMAKMVLLNMCAAADLPAGEESRADKVGSTGAVVMVADTL